MKLADHSWIELHRLQLDDNEAPKFEMIEEQIELGVVTADFECDLASDEREARPELQEEALDVRDQRRLDLVFLTGVRGADEVEQVRVLEHLCGEVGIVRWQRSLEVVERLPLPCVEPARDLKREDVARPAMLDGARGVPEALGLIVELLDQREMVVPGQLCKRCLHNFTVGPHRRERTHVVQVSR